MIDQHISEQEVQQAVLDKTQLSATAAQHLDQCSVCQTTVKEYELLFSSIESLPEPSFDFDIVDLVMPLLPEKKKANSGYNVPLIVVVLLIACGMLIASFFLLNIRLRIDELWPSISPWLMGIGAVVVGAWIGISLADLYSNYKAQIRALDLSS